MKVSDVEVVWKRSCRSENNVKANLGGTSPKKESSRQFF